MSRRLASVAMWLVAVTLLGCGKDSGSQAGGGSWDETENTIAVRVLDAQSSPVAGAQVRLVAVAGWASRMSGGYSPVLDSAVSSQDGMVQLVCKASDGQVAVEVSQDSFASRLQDDAVRLSERGALAMLQPSASVQGRIPVPGMEIRLGGTSLLTRSQSDGSFSLTGIPLGSHALVLVDTTGANRALDVASFFQLTAGGKVALGDISLPSADSVVLEDFEDGLDRNRFTAFTGSGWWYSGSDGISEADVEGSGNGLAGKSCGESRCLVAHLLVNDTVYGKFALVGMDIDAGSFSPDSLRATHDLSGMDSLVFRAKGSGSLKVQFILSSHVKKLLPYQYAFHADIVLDSVWERHVIRPVDIVGPEKNPEVSVEEALRYISGFTWNAGDSVDLWLDDIVLHGVDQADLFQMNAKER